MDKLLLAVGCVANDRPHLVRVHRVGGHEIDSLSFSRAVDKSKMTGHIERNGVNGYARKF